MAKIRILVIQHTCTRCGHQWISKLEKPVRCPRCTSQYWNKPRQRKRRR